MPTTREKGNVAEDIACRFISSKGFEVVERNYQRKWGEIDIVAKKGEVLHFFEVKSVLVRVARSKCYRPEENVHDLKLRRLRRVIQTYLADAKTSPDASIYFHVVCVYVNMRTRRAKVEWHENIVI